MYEKFKYERLALSLIKLDSHNPRIVTQDKLASQHEIIAYFFEHESLADFLELIAREGRNPGAERPYVVKLDKEYMVVEGNTRIAAYKLLTGQLIAPADYAHLVPHIPEPMRDELVSVDCAIAPSRDSLRPIMARAHFGRGDKAQWGYLGSRKAVYDEWKEGRSFGQLASIFDRPQGAIRDLVLEYEVYLEALKLTWTAAEKVKLLEPSVEFNPPVRFLQTSGHKQLVGLDLDRINMPIKFIAPDSKAKFQHLIRSMIIVQKGPSATASYAEVFADYVVPAASGEGCGQQVSPQGCGSARNAGTGAANTGTSGGNAAINQASVGGSTKLKLGALFDYPVLVNDLTLKQLMKEANDLNTKRFPAAGTSLLRSIIELGRVLN